jgi:hypothetical protein
LAINMASTFHRQNVNGASTRHQHSINTPSTPHQQNINTADAQLADAAAAVLVSKRPAPGLSRASDQVLLAVGHRSQKSLATSSGDASRSNGPARLHAMDGIRKLQPR